MGWKGKAANVHYGRLAGLLCEILGRVENADNVYILAELRKKKDEDWVWVMRPNLAAALADLKWV